MIFNHIIQSERTSSCCFEEKDEERRRRRKKNVDAPIFRSVSRSMNEKSYSNMLKAVATVTTLLILLTYIFLLTLTYPFVCWIKHRPAEQPLSSISSFPKLNDQQICSEHLQLSLMPMPLKIDRTNSKIFFSIPTEIRIKSKWKFSFGHIIRSVPNATFTLVIDFIDEYFYPEFEVDESYQLNISSTHRAFLFAKTSIGIHRGLATFLQLQNPTKKISIPLFIDDKARFPWRGLMFDVARHFIPLSIIRQTIDQMYLVKLNVLHLHLSDDQAFRFESRLYPRLHDRHEFYSQTELRNLIEYARQRAIRIVPEFDMPAHTSSWFVGYPQLASVRRQDFQLEKRWGVMNSTMDVTLETTYQFLDHFFSEIVQVFPDPIVHIGGDECEPFEWMQSETIQSFMRQQQLNDHLSLQSYFTRRIEKLLNKYNRTLMGWDEIVNANLSRTAIIQSWRDKSSLINAAQQGLRGILSNGFYLDHMSSAEFHYRNNLQFENFVSYQTLTKRILGGEACLWTEYIDGKMVQSRTWPRTAAIAERLWSWKSDEIDCMYQRLFDLNRRFFNPNDDDYRANLMNLTRDIDKLRILADVCEPLGLQGRDRRRNYTSQTLLNRFVDILRPESQQVRLLISPLNLTALHLTFILWQNNDLSSYVDDPDILQLSNNLNRLADLGLHLLTMFDAKTSRPIVSSRWYNYHWYILDSMEYQVPEIRLAGVRLVRQLLRQFAPCSFDLINLSLLLCFPLMVIIAQRVPWIRRRLLLPCLNMCYYYSMRCFSVR